MKNFKRTLSLMLAMVLFTSYALAQNQGNLSGLVKDSDGSTLPGAAIVVKGSTLGTSTDMNGKYSLRGIPAGEVAIEITYLGYNTLEQNVVINNNKTTVCNFVLEEASISLQGVVVSGIVQGQQRALNQQKVADNMTQIISADQIGKFPDPNVSDALKRLSGVTTDGENVQLRGTPANFTNINVNGEQIMGSQSEGQRNESLDVIPSDILSSLEVKKTLLPSDDGDAIAGVINMKTGTASSLEPKFIVDLGGGVNTLRYEPTYNIKAGYSQRFFENEKNPNGVFGVLFNYSYINKNSGYERLEAQSWSENDLVSASTGEVLEQDVYVPTDFRYRYQESQSVRNGVTLVLDWAPTTNTKFTLSTIYNNRTNDDLRYRNRFRFRENDDEYYVLDDGSIGAVRVKNISQVTTQDTNIDNININLDGETTVGSWKIDGGMFYNKSSRKFYSAMAGFETSEYRAGKNGIDDGTIIATIPAIEKYLTMDYVYSPDGSPVYSNDASRYNMYILENHNTITVGQNMTARINASKNYFINDYASTLSFGIKGKFMKSVGYVPSGTVTYDVESSDANNLTNMLYTNQLTSSFMNGNLAFGIAPDMDKVLAYMSSASNQGDISTNDYSTNMNIDESDYQANESVISTYIMNKTQFNKLMVLAGVRIERTDVDYTANKIDPFYNENATIYDDEGDYNDYTCTRVTESLNYIKILPNIQFKYDLTNNTILRLAWTTGYSRPDVLDLVPTQSVSQEEETLTVGNPDLKPAYANNIDLLFERYLSNVGIISGGFFAKHIDEFHYLSEVTIDDASSSYDGWLVTQNQNGESAMVYGAEITLNYNLTFLPSFLKNLMLTSNYTYTYSNAETDIDRGATRLPGQAAHTANIALAYSTKKFTLQASANYMGSYIVALGADADRDIWQDARWQIDLNGSVQLYKNLSLWVEATNIFNAEEYTYYGDISRVYELQFNGASIRSGLTYRF